MSPKPKVRSRGALARRVLPHTVFWFAVAAIVLLFELLVRSGGVSPATFAAPSETIMRALSLLSTRSFLGHVASTLVRTIIAAGLGFPAGILVAVGILVLGPARRSGELVLDFLRSIPLTALVPFFIVAYGVGDSAKIAIGAVASGLTAAIAVWVGIRESRSRASLFLYLYRPSIRGILLAILPGALPSVAGALRLAVSYALVLVIVAEMFIGSGSGLGRAIVDFSYTDDRPAQYAAIGVAGALGYVLNALADVVSRYVGRIVQT